MTKDSVVARDEKGRITVRSMVGLRFGLVTVLRQSGHSRSREAKWLCRCDCGVETVVNGSSLRRGDTQSCGAGKHKVTHGMVGTPEYYLWENAKNRAKACGRAFTLTVGDIVIPDACPVLGIPLFKGEGKCSDNSPTVDRVNPSGGYTIDNIKIISHRANSIKRNATIEELELIVAYMRENGAGMALERKVA